jgi:hypothetical protein
MRLADPIVVSVNPDPQVLVYRIVRIYHSIAVSAIHRIVEYRQRDVPVPITARSLQSEVAKELGKVINRSVSVSIQREPPFRHRGSVQLI